MAAALRTAQPQQTTAPAGQPLTLEARLAAREADMTLRLEAAAIAHEVNTAHLALDPVDLADIIIVPDAPAPPPPAAYTTPVAALLERAQHRMRSAGWCAGALTDDEGRVCILGAIRAEAGGDRALEADATTVVLDSIRRRFGDHVPSVPAFNDAHGSGRTPILMVGEAARLADARCL
ncbi:DUF6197 family protein [Streptomyces albidocamelliae]|uniref:Uncharacterized protein n=1 Tax=Streptomyces albidocamelliae TaxID=2981135 RepID=A0ABY6F1L4_9ACTN|nr:hypothetical protein [Streptomyces sp. HUAS 14-6]UXY40512.1 hypothetical protein N8I86_38780 [Streptomyces sp. HUAS 14-6]